MGRELKFRCFDLETKAMNYWDLDHYDRENHDTFGNAMQFTGLKDKNDTNIYEGDIISMTTGKPVAIVQYDYCGFVFQWIDPVYMNVRKQNEPIFRNVHLFEVIGNIHQTPELL